MKKKLLFVIDSLGIGGAEKSLVSLLRLLDYSKYEVDLQLFAYQGGLQRFLPDEVRILPPLNYTRFLMLPVWRQVCHPSMLLARLRYSLTIRSSMMLNSEMAVAYWRNIGQCISRNPRHYDVAIAYAQGIPTFYVADKISAFKKIGWVNACYRLSESARNYQRKFYEQCNFIVPVSEIVRNVLSETYPEFTNKMYVVRDIINAESLKAMSEYVCDKKIDHSYPVLMTVGRLDKLTKGYDLALAAAKVLKNRKIKFKWYVIGEGPSRSDIERHIIESNLSDCFILLGATDNPYSYMRQCDVYVQTSRHEGFGLTMAEARILNRPVVCTNFDGCTVQITDGKNGLITSFAPEDIADSIERLLNDKVLYSEIQEYLKNEKKGNTEEIANFYKLIES